MKKLQLSLLCLIMSIGLSDLMAQSYGSFEWDIIRLGYVTPAGDGITGGGAISSAPRYNISDKLSIELRGEVAFFGTEAEDESIGVGASASWALIGDYYILNNFNRRLFAGAGIGIFSSGDLSGTVNGVPFETEGSSSLGFVGRIGYELGFIRLTGEYNLTTSDNPSNYLGVHLGFNIGGRYKK